MNKKTISVIIPVFNRETYLDKCLQSVLSQKDVDMDIILIDDGSTDNTTALCDEYGKKYDNIRVFHQANSGLAVARNNGLDVAKGDYISFVDSDDYLPEDSLSTLLELQEKTDADMVFGNYAICHDDGSFDKIIALPDKYSNKLLSKREACEFLLYCVDTHVLMVSWGKLFKREVWSNIRFPAKGIKSQDQFVFPALMRRCSKIYYTDKIVYNQVFSNNSITRSKPAKKTLLHPEGISVVIQYLIDMGFYDIALYKFGVGSRFIMYMKHILRDEECAREIYRLYKIYCELALELIPHVRMKERIRLRLYRINMDIYELVESVYSKYYKLRHA